MRLRASEDQGMGAKKHGWDGMRAPDRGECRVAAALSMPLPCVGRRRQSQIPA